MPDPSKGNPRIAAYLAAHPGKKFDPFPYSQWIRKMLHKACDEERGVFKFTGDPVPHISDHDEFTKFLEEQAHA